MGDERRTRRDPRLPFQEIEGRALVLVPERLEAHEFDEAATLLWRELERRRSVKDLATALCEEYDVEPDRAEQWVRSFLEELAGKGLVVEG